MWRIIRGNAWYLGFHGLEGAGLSWIFSEQVDCRLFLETCVCLIQVITYYHPHAKLGQKFLAKWLIPILIRITWQRMNEKGIYCEKLIRL
jgi:hypothetical protein